MGILEYIPSTPARLTSLRVGRTLHQPFALEVSGDHDPLWNRHPIAENGHLGMVFLLRYPAVCFAWDEAAALLGRPWAVRWRNRAEPTASAGQLGRGVRR